MISARAGSAIEWLFEKAVRDHAGGQGSHDCQVRPIDALPEPVEGREGRLVVLNIASYLFRIVAVFDFPPDAASAGHFARLTRSKEPRLAGQALHDAHAELVNLICGSVNRTLVQHFRHVGMSTPFALDGHCGGYLDMLRPSHRRDYLVKMGEGASFHLALCTCVAEGATLDFDVDRHEAEAEVTGELELF